MANIVVMTGHYYPYFSPNGSIMKNIVDQLRKAHSVKVLAVKNRFELSDSDSYDGYEIERVNDFSTSFHNYCADKNQRNYKGITSKYYNFLLQSKRVLSLVKKTVRSTSIDKALVKRQLKSLNKINNTFHIDVIIPVSMPIENIIAAIEYGKTNFNTKILPYQVDHFTESNTLHNFDFIKKIRYDTHLSIEKDILKSSFHYFIFPQIENHIRRSEFAAFQNKITVTEHPLLSEKKQSLKSNEINYEEEKINLVFAGMLNTRKRNPIHLLDLLSEIPASEKLCFNVFHVGDCDGIINRYQKNLGSNLKNFGQVPLDTAFEAMSKGDVLVNIGVTDGNQVSGKIFDYFATGKPIVHLYFFDEDPNLVYFNDYSMSLCLKIDPARIQENSRKLLDFCKKYTGKSIPFEEVKKTFYYATPEHVSSEFLRVIETS